MAPLATTMGAESCGAVGAFFLWESPLRITSHASGKRVYRVMKVHGVLLDRHAGGVERRHDGRIAVDERNRRWCSDGFEIGCDNGERVRVACALDCCDREAVSFLVTTGGISGDDVRDLMVVAVEHRFGRVNRLPVTIEWRQLLHCR
jgi:putative transposase